MKKRGDFKIDFLSGDYEDWKFYREKGYINIKDVRDNFSKLPLRKFSLKLYKKWKLDKDEILLTNFIRYKKFGTKTIRHWADDEKYKFLSKIFKIAFPDKIDFQKAKPIHKILYLLSKLFLIPILKIPDEKTYRIPRYIHKYVYYTSKLYLLALDRLPKTVRLIIWKKKFQDINLIALINAKKGFRIISKVVLQFFLSYYLILKEINPDLVLIYNGSWAFNTPLTAACRKLDIPHYFIETSYFVGYSELDSISVWHDGELNIKELPEWDDEKEVKLNEWIITYLKKYKRGIASMTEDDNGIKSIIPKKRFIFLPLQIMDDTNNIKYSPLIANNLQIVNLVINNAPIGYEIIIKRHPGDFLVGDPLYKQNLKMIGKIAEKYDHVHLYHYADSQLLLKNCSALIVINSTISIENLLHARVPMLILGDHILRGWGFSYDVNNLEEFEDKLKEALDKGVSPKIEKKMKQFLYLYIFDYIVKGHYPLIYHICDKNGNIIKTFNKPQKYKYIAERLYNELNKIKERKEKGHKRRLPLPKKYKCMIDRTKLPNYTGVILDYFHGV